MIRTGIATNEAIAESLKDHNTPLSYGATPDKWKEALTTISGDDETIAPREVEGEIGFMSTNETVLKSFNANIDETEDEEETEEETEKVTVNIYFTESGSNVELDELPTLGGVTGTLDSDHYVFEVEPASGLTLSYKYNGTEGSCVKDITADLDDVIVIA